MQIIFFSFVVGILKIYYFPEFFLFPDPIFFGKKIQKSESYFFYFYSSDRLTFGLVDF